MKLFIKKRNKNRGQGVMEYMIITSLIGVVCLAAVKGVGESVKNRLEKSSQKINKIIKI